MLTVECWKFGQSGDFSGPGDVEIAQKLFEFTEMRAVSAILREKLEIRRKRVTDKKVVKYFLN